jgi:hypothetical protein
MSRILFDCRRYHTRELKIAERVSMSPAGQSNEFFNGFERADCPNPMVKATPLPLQQLARCSQTGLKLVVGVALTPLKRPRPRRFSALPQVRCLWFRCSETDALQLLIRQDLSVSFGTIERGRLKAI